MIPHIIRTWRAAAIVVVTLVSFGCSTASYHAGTDAPAPTLDRIRNATIPGIFLEPVTLNDGVYEGAPYFSGGASRPRVTLWDSPAPSGPLRGVSGNVTAAFLSETSGGSGERIYLAAFRMDGSELQHLGTALIGDRTKVRSASFSDGEIVVDVVETGAKQAACCGTQLARKRYVPANDTLTLSSSQLTGILSLATASGRTWKLVSINGRSFSTDPPTLTFETGRVTGFSGCNRYTGQVSERTPGQIDIVRLAGTKTACGEAESDLERRFLEALAETRSYTFLAGRLALTTLGRRGTGLLLFESEPPN